MICKRTGDVIEDKDGTITVSNPIPPPEDWRLVVEEKPITEMIVQRKPIKWW